MAEVLMLKQPTDSTVVFDRGVLLQQATRRLTEFYERTAYLVYNLALRITCEQESAIVAVETAFLAQGEGGDNQSLLVAVTSQALSVAHDHPSPSGAGDQQSETMLQATAGLSPPQRAILALEGLAEASPAQLALQLKLDEQAASRLLARTNEAFASAIRSPVERARQLYRGWSWAPPP